VKRWEKLGRVTAENGREHRKKKYRIRGCFPDYKVPSALTVHLVICPFTAENP
jgi:hypothetical protein